MGDGLPYLTPSRVRSPTYRDMLECRPSILGVLPETYEIFAPNRVRREQRQHGLVSQSRIGTIEVARPCHRER